MMKKYLKWTAVILALVFAGIQFVRPARTNPPIDEAQTVQAKLNVPPEIDQILARSCNDCHSNRTDWIWYSNIAPASWFMIYHVNEGRAEINFSEWGTLSAGRASRKLEEICEQVETGEMPIWNYVLLHPSAHLTDADKKALCDWTKQEREKIDRNLPQTSNRRAKSSFPQKHTFPFRTETVLKNFTSSPDNKLDSAFSKPFFKWGNYGSNSDIYVRDRN